MESYKKIVENIIDSSADEIIKIVKDIDLNPELGFQEHRTSQIVADFLKKNAYQVEQKIAITGVKTYLRSPRAKYTIAFIGELDGVICKESAKASPKDGATHTCGHHLQTGILLLVAKALQEANIIDQLDGNIAFIAVPAEEYIQLTYRQELKKQEQIRYLSGKQEFIRLGVFDDIDAAIMMHAEPYSEEPSVFIYHTGNGFRVKEVSCKGKTAHAAAAPHEGVNALHALIQGINNINALRDTFVDDNHNRVHYIITKGGDNVNSVPSETELQAYVRSSDIDEIENLSQKFDKAFQTAADNFGAKVSIKTLAGYMPLICNSEMNAVFEENAKAFIPQNRIIDRGHFMASTDLGDLSHLIPVIQPMMGGIRGGLHAPDFEVLDYNAALVTPAKIVANTIIDLLSHNRLSSVLENYDAKLSKEEYIRLMNQFDNE